MATELATRMKAYELDTTFDSDAFVVLRVDGRGFHTVTRRFRTMHNQDPFDDSFIHAMNYTAKELMNEVGGTARMAYCQSDEISIIIRATGNQSPWFGNRKAKMESIGASVATAAFNDFMHITPTPNFDARAFTLPNEMEVSNYLYWRQLDWRRNMVTSLARHVFGHSDIQNKKTVELRNLLALADNSPEEYPLHYQNGTFISTNRFVGPEELPAPIFTTNRDAVKELLQ